MQLIFAFVINASFYGYIKAKITQKETISFDQLPEFLQSLNTIATDLNIKSLAKDIAQYKSLAYIVNENGVREDLNHLMEKEMVMKDIYAFSTMDGYKELTKEVKKDVFNSMSSVDNSMWTISYWTNSIRSLFSYRYKELGHAASSMMIRELMHDAKHLNTTMGAFAYTRLALENGKETRFSSDAYTKSITDFQEFIVKTTTEWKSRFKSIQRSWISFRYELDSQLDPILTFLFDYALEFGKKDDISINVLRDLIIIHMDALFFQIRNK